MKLFNVSGSAKLRGSGFRVLNVIRVCNIISLGSVMAGSMVMIITTGMTNQFFFFDAATHLLLFFWALGLAFSELQFAWVGRYFARNWPVFGPDHSFAWLGWMMISLGCNMLGNLNKPAFFIDNIGLPLWRLILAAGILSITFGVTNIVSSIIFRDGENQITARMIRSDGNLAAAKPDPMNDYYSTRSASVRQVDEGRREKAFKRLTQHMKSPFGQGKKIQISKPMPHQAHVDDDLESGDHWDDRSSPVMPDVQRPPTALHPAYTGGNKSSHYSVANMERF